MKMGLGSGDFDYPSLKKLLDNTTAEVLLPGDGEEYEKSIERWSEHCIKQAVRSPSSVFLYKCFCIMFTHLYEQRLL